jgi:hypothetical protein
VTTTQPTPPAEPAAANAAANAAASAIPAANPAPAPASGTAPAPAARRSIRPPDPATVSRVVAAALTEDLILGDPTTDSLFGPEAATTAVVLLKEPGVVAGLPIVAAVFAAIDPGVAVTPSHFDGDAIPTEAIPVELVRISGPTRAILRSTSWAGCAASPP